ncbi:hypothetical protein APHAL10511_007592 [Amanita phalloides]|nr:hypothetical protein APHAL10511_007592 [Amanita phalloides]
MILDKMDPPPRYTPKASVGSLLALLPPHVLLRIVYGTAPDLDRQEQQRKTLYWLSTNLRLVNRAFYIASMHILRSAYLPHYLSLVRSPYTSDPFPVANDFSPGAAPLYAPGSSTIHPIQRESNVLDLFIALKVREDVWMDDSELHLEREESFRDLFDLHQPRRRLEDLIRIYGTQDAVITLGNTSSPGSSVCSMPLASTTSLVPQSQSLRSMSFFRRFTLSAKSSAPVTTPPQSATSSVTPISFSSLSVSFTPRKVGLMVTETQRKRTIVEVQRDRQDPLETTAQQLVFELTHWLRGS